MESSAYSVSFVFSVIVKIIAFIVNIMVMRYQIKELTVVRNGVPYVGVFLLATNLLVTSVIIISFVISILRTYFTIHPIMLLIFTNYLSVVYLFFAVKWLVLYKNYYLKRNP